MKNRSAFLPNAPKQASRKALLLSTSLCILLAATCSGAAHASYTVLGDNIGAQTGGVTPAQDTYQLYSYTFTATQSNNYLSFLFRDDPAVLYFSQASLLDATTGVNLLTNGDFSTGGYINANGTTVPNNWISIGTVGLEAAGNLSSGCGYNGSDCWADGVVGGFDGIAQAVTLNTGSTYTLSFYANSLSAPWAQSSVELIAGIGDLPDGYSATAPASNPIDTAAGYYLASNLGSSVTADFQGGTLRVDSSSTISSDFTIESFSGNTIDAYGNTANFSGAMTGAGGLTFTDSQGGGTIVLSGANSYSGTTIIDSVALVAGATNTLSSNSDVVLANSANTSLSLGGYNQTILSLSGGGSNGGNVDLGSATLTISNGGNYGGVISGSGALALSGGNLILTGANTFTGDTQISSGATLQLGNGGSTGSVAGNIVDNGALVFDRSYAVFGGNISGTGSLTQAGTDTLVLTGTNTYTGGTIISSGVLQVGDGTTNGSITGDVVNNVALAFYRSDTVTFDGSISGTGQVGLVGSGTVILTGTNTYTGGTYIISGPLQIGNGGTTGSIVGDIDDRVGLVFDRSDTVTFDGNISDTGSLTQAGSGTLILTSDNTYTGGTTISSGTLQLGNGGTTGSVAGNIVNNGALVFDRSDSIAFGGNISGTGSLTQAGSGTLYLTATNSYTGGTTIASGLLVAGDGTTNGSITGDVVNNSALAFYRSDTVTFSGSISGTGVVGQVGSGTLILTANNTYTGGTIISAGTLQLGNGGTTGSVVGNILDNGALVFARSDTYAYGNVISGTGTVAVSSGKVVLNGQNTYTGATTVTNGTLIIGDASHTTASVTSNVTAGSGGTVGGYGTIKGNLIASGGTVSPGNSIGTLTVTGNYNQSANSSLEMEVAPNTNDKLVVGGAASLNGTLNVALASGNYSSSVYSLVSAGSVNGTFSTVNYSGTTSNMIYGIYYAPSGKEVDLAMTPKTAGQVYGDVVTSSLDNAITLNRTTMDHLNTVDGKGSHLWAKTLSGAGYTEGDWGLADYNTQMWGMIGGADYLFDNGAKFSGVFGYTHNQLGVSGQDTKAATNGYYLSLAARLPVYGFNVDVAGFAMNNLVGVSRATGYTGTAKGKANNFINGASVEISYPLEAGDVLPFARFTVASLHADSFSESNAGALALSVDKTSKTSLRGTWGVEVSHSYTTENGTLLVPRFTVGMENDFGQSGRDLSMQLAGTDFTSPATAPAEFSALLGAGLKAKLSNSFELSLDADGRMSRNQKEGTLSIGANYKF